MNMNRCKPLSTFLLVLAAVIGGACASGIQPGSSSQNQMTGHEAAAKKALETLPMLVTKDNFSGMGFSSVEEAQAGTLGTPMRRRTIGYDKLLNYRPGTPLAQLFEAHEEFVYPVLVRQSVKTSIVVAATTSGWQISSVGDRYLASIISSAGQTTPTTLPGAPTPTPATTPPIRNLELVSMPGINFDLVSFSEGEQTLVQPTSDLLEAQLFKGRRLKAEDALIAISNYAKEFDRKYGAEIRRRRLAR